MLNKKMNFKKWLIATILGAALLSSVFLLNLSPRNNASALTGDGSAGNPYIIATAADLAEMRGHVNSGAAGHDSAGRHYMLTADIGLAAYGNWTPIGNTTYPFKGIFDGGGFVIFDLKINADLYLGA